jgi:catechol 2,3-dioxygenase-like lactoylglutathione lyase family enzyme
MAEATVAANPTAKTRALPQVSPAKFAHIVFRSNQLQAMVDWYAAVLQAKVVHGDKRIAFLSYDDEHHRVAIVAMDQYAEKPTGPGFSVGFYHAAFTYRDVAELLGSYARLKAQGIVPYRTINHGPTLSFYYNDPDLNNIEMQVDAFASLDECTEFMRGPLFSENPIGIPVDPEQLLARYHAGATDAELLKRADRV